MGEMRIMDATGDAVVQWSREFQEEIDTAEDRFNELVVQGNHQAFEILPGGKGKKIEKFDPDAGRITIFPNLSGG